MPAPRFLLVDDAVALARAGADLVCETVAGRRSASIVVATGDTPMGLYAELAARRRSGGFDPSDVTVLQLDEYLDLDPDDRRSLYGWMRRSFLEPLGIDDARVVRLPLDGDLAEACAAFDRAMDERGPADLAILGLGVNGHLGFNEPPSDRSSSTREVRLSAQTIEANTSYWGTGAVPTRAVTLGMRHLLAARRILLLVSGARKRTIVHRAVEGPVDPDVPASYLQEVDGDVTVIVDRAAWGGG